MCCQLGGLKTPCCSSYKCHSSLSPTITPPTDMDPLTALGVASNVIQIVDFSSRILSRTQEIYRSRDGRLQEHVILDDAATNLLELVTDLQNIQVPKRKQQTTADGQLVQLRNECKTVAQELHNLLEQAKIQGDHRKWQSVYQAIKSVYSENKIASVQLKLDGIRKRLDTVLLVTLR
jgi:Skp family chaperone for outer membrane proteins